MIGNYTYGLPPPLNPHENPAVTPTTLYDMASLTKVLSTTTAVMQFYERGQLDLRTSLSPVRICSLAEWEVSSARLLGSAFAQKGKGSITVANLLLHDSGFPPDPSPNYCVSHACTL